MCCDNNSASVPRVRFQLSTPFRPIADWRNGWTGRRTAIFGQQNTMIVKRSADPWGMLQRDECSMLPRLAEDGIDGVVARVCGNDYGTG